MAKRTTKLKAVILAGGSGERFWPLSTADKPKQFLKVFGEESLLRQTFSRLKGLVEAEDVFVVTAKTLVASTRKELPEIPRRNIIGEPMRRDTAAAVALGVEAAGDGVIVFLPADQLIGKVKAFQAALKKAVKLAERKTHIVTLGVKPDRASTSFGYIDPETGKFVEKPDEKTAAEYIRRGYLWNAGMFIAESATFRRAFSDSAPELLGLKASEKAYEKLPKISFDFAIMEKEAKVEVVPADCDWDDVGSYAAFEKRFAKDACGNVALGQTSLVETKNSIVIGNGPKVSLLGVENLVVVSTSEGVLVMPKTEISNLKKLFR